LTLQSKNDSILSRCIFGKGLAWTLKYLAMRTRKKELFIRYHIFSKKVILPLFRKEYYLKPDLIDACTGVVCTYHLPRRLNSTEEVSDYCGATVAGQPRYYWLRYTHRVAHVGFSRDILPTLTARMIEQTSVKRKASSANLARPTRHFNLDLVQSLWI
jgi:hypothetical protein